MITVKSILIQKMMFGLVRNAKTFMLTSFPYLLKVSHVLNRLKHQKISSTTLILRSMSAETAMKIMWTQILDSKGACAKFVISTSQLSRESLTMCFVRVKDASLSLIVIKVVLDSDTCHF